MSSVAGSASHSTCRYCSASNFGISTVGDRDYYELFGELAPASSLDDILIELRVLAENAIEAASDLRSSFTPA